MGKSHHTARRSKCGSNRGIPGHAIRRHAAERQGKDAEATQISKHADVGLCQDKEDGGHSLSEAVTIGPGSSIGSQKARERLRAKLAARRAQGIAPVLGPAAAGKKIGKPAKARQRKAAKARAEHTIDMMT